MTGLVFGDLLEQAVERRAAAEVGARPAIPADRRRRGPGPVPHRAGDARTASSRGPESPGASPRAPARTGTTARPVIGAGGGASATTAERPGSGFWSQLARVQAELGPPRDTSQALLGIVGPLTFTMPIARRELERRGSAACDVAVLTARTDILSEPSWRLVRDGTLLVREAVEHAQPHCLLLVDTGPDLPHWVGPLVDRLRGAGVDLVRYVVAGDPSDADLARSREALGGPLLFDLAGRIPPRRVLELVARGEPVASVGGVPVTAELVVAMEAGVRHQEQVCGVRASDA